MPLNTDALLAWSANVELDLAGYVIHYGTVSGVYDHALDVALTPTPLTPQWYFWNLPYAGTWYFAMTAYNSSGQSSGFSVEHSKIIAPPTWSTSGFPYRA